MSTTPAMSTTAAMSTMAATAVDGHGVGAGVGPSAGSPATSAGGLPGAPRAFASHAHHASRRRNTSAPTSSTPNAQAAMTSAPGSASSPPGSTSTPPKSRIPARSGNQ